MKRAAEGKRKRGPNSSQSDRSVELWHDDEVKWYSQDANPHLEQCKQNTIGIIKTDDIKLARVLSDDAYRLQYRRRQNEIKSVVHWGQRKLLICEIEFLTKFSEEGITCIYAGAAPGTHISFLSRLFPEVHFVLIDPSDFSFEPNSKITTRQEFMTNEIAEEFQHMKTIFLSDVRSADWRTMNEIQLESHIKKDMTNQMNWHLALKPIASLLKFRLPWTSGSTLYLEGDIYLPVWGPQTTTESRLLVTTSNLKVYDHDSYNERMFFFNNATRVFAYKHDIIDINATNDCIIHQMYCDESLTQFDIDVECEEGVDFCYDCSSEIKVLKDYLKSSPHRLSTWCTSNQASMPLSRQLSNITSANDDNKNSCPSDHCDNEKILSASTDLFSARLVIEGTRQLMSAATLACNGKNDPGSQSFRSLANWRRTYDFRKKIYDTENKEIIELSDLPQRL